MAETKDNNSSALRKENARPERLMVDPSLPAIKIRNQGEIDFSAQTKYNPNDVYWLSFQGIIHLRSIKESTVE